MSFSCAICTRPATVKIGVREPSNALPFIARKFCDIHGLNYAIRASQAGCHFTVEALA